MYDVVQLLLRYVRGIWQYRWWMLGVAWTIALIGWILVARMPDQFQASARVYVDTSSVLQPYLQGLAIRQSDTQRKIFLMTRTLLSRPNLEKVMRITDLDLQAKTPEEKEKLLDELRENIEFAGTSRENLYTIQYQDESADLAKLVVKSLLTIFMEGNLGEARKSQDSAAQFLEQQIEDYERRIREAQETLIRFKQRNIDLLPNEQGGYYQRVRELQARAAEAELDLRVQEDRLTASKAYLGGEEPTFGLGPPPKANLEAKVDTSTFDRRIANMEMRLDDLLVKYTDRHPDIISTKKGLEELKTQKDDFVAEQLRTMTPQEASQGYDVGGNSFYQEMQISVAKLEADVAGKRRILDEYKAQLADLESKLDKSVDLERRQAELVQSIAAMKKNQTDLSTRLEQARLGREADTNSESVQFRVIDPPRVPLKPSGPNRVLFSSAVLIIGLAFGVALAFLMSQLRPTFDERQMLNESLGLPVLGSVNMVWTSEQVSARRVRNATYIVSFTSLLLTFGVVLALYQFDINVLPRLAQSLNLS